ncbi:MAG: hypothetical protein MUF31_10960 [Akkermansiaceae bacterium]|jgi:hypothetical protein|nr:hypothetical protein [Akkermansiaceae bacterium]
MLREGEVGIVRVPAATMTHLLGLLPPAKVEGGSPPGSPNLLEVIPVDALMEMLGDKRLGGASMSTEGKVSMDRSGRTVNLKSTRMPNSSLQLLIEFMDESEIGLEVFIRTMGGHVLFFSAGKGSEEGYLFVVGGGENQTNPEKGGKAKEMP